MGLRVVALGFPLASPIWGGIPWATYRLMENITRLHPEHSFHLLMYEPPASVFGADMVERLVDTRDNLDTSVVAKGREATSWCEQNADLVWGPASGVLRTRRVPQVFTHHDMRMFGHLRESFINYMKHRAGLNYAMREATAVVTITDSTRRETLAHYKEPQFATKTCTILWGVPEGFDDAEEVEPLRPGTVEGEHYISTIYDPFPHKRMDLLEAVLPLLDAHGWDLVVIGGMRGGDVDITVDHPRVHYTGFVGYDVLPRYIKASSLFLHPSEYEGFGHPPYEAMALGVPVLYNRRCVALSEGIGDVTHSFSDDADLPRVLGQLMGSDEDRVRHVASGRALAARFPWDLTARRYMYLFERVHEHGGRPLDFPGGDPEPPSVAVPDPGQRD